MTASTIDDQRVTLTIPAECVDDFRCATIRDAETEAEMFHEQHALLAELERNKDHADRADRDANLRELLAAADVLGQLPDDDAESTVSGPLPTIRYILDVMGRGLTEQIRQQYEYGPAAVEKALVLLGRLQWAAEQASMLGGC